MEPRAFSPWLTSAAFRWLTLEHWEVYVAPSTSLVDVMAEPGHVALRGATSSSFSLCVDRMVSITSSVGSLKSWRKSSFQAVRDGDFVEFYAILCILNSYFAWDALRVYMEWHRDFIRRSEMHDLRLGLGPSPCGFFATSPRHHSSSILPRSLIPCWSGSQIASNELIEQLASAKDKQNRASESLVHSPWPLFIAYTGGR